MLLPDPPMELGQTYKGKDADGNLINGHLLGLVYTFPNSPVNGLPRAGKSRNTGKPITAVLLRNETGLTIYGKRFAMLSNAGGYNGVEAVSGYNATLGNFGIVLIDPFLPSGGCADDELFWGVISGAVLIKSPFAAGHVGGSIALGSLLVAATAATTGTSESGRVTTVAIANATDATNADVRSRAVGRALSAATTAQTDTDVLVDLAIRL